MTIRTLRADEHEALLELLDGWELPDGWRGRDFFRRFLEHDPSYDDANVLVAEDAGRLVACVQIFPRRLLLRGRAIPAGGIGSVFTRPEARGSGVASALLAASADAMRARGMLLSLLFAERIGFYTRAGWTSWPSTRALIRPAEGAAPPVSPPDVVIRPLDPARDLAAVERLHASRLREGCALRDAAAWTASLRLAGNPHEELLVARAPAGAARDGAPLVAYLRATRMSGVLVLTEWARSDAPEATRAVAGLVGALLGPRDPDPLATGTRPSVELRRFVVAPPLLDPALEAALEASGLALRSLPDPSAMLRCLDAPALARALGEPMIPDEDAVPYLQRMLPPERFGFWPADRF